MSLLELCIGRTNPVGGLEHLIFVPHILEIDDNHTRVIYIYISYYIWLVVWNMFYFSIHILGTLIPFDFHIFQRGGLKPPTRNVKSDSFC